MQRIKTQNIWKGNNNDTSKGITDFESHFKSLFLFLLQITVNKLVQKKLNFQIEIQFRCFRLQKEGKTFLPNDTCSAY